MSGIAGNARLISRVSIAVDQSEQAIPSPQRPNSEVPYALLLLQKGPETYLLQQVRLPRYIDQYCRVNGRYASMSGHGGGPWRRRVRTWMAALASPGSWSTLSGGASANMSPITESFGASGPQKTALIALAADKTVYLLYVFALSKLPESLITILTSKYCIKVGRGISADFHKLARDFPEFKLPKKKHKKIFHSCLSKEARASDWSAIPYSDSQKEYAALDAYIALALYEQLSSMQTNAQQLSAKTQVGQEVTLIVRNHPVAEGIIAVQPLFVKLDDDSKLGVGTTKTRALVTFTKVLAPDYVLSLHKKTLGELQDNQESFEAVVNIAYLRTKSLKSFDIPQQSEPECKGNLEAREYSRVLARGIQRDE
ncbi:ribonuclease H-like domain-containing protein [Mycena pura]|uniref:Ribonuclease H-like domain-containing protein n=1 Tax=Mycena pura TaxID=153505 RepID=A0AAD6VAP1_9AGAR|nr:ribonuclease H-like domain-containing protein [Mycena pura]